MILGAIEAGGTKFVLAVGNEKGEITEKVSIPTRTPEETMPEIYAFFKDKRIEALGIGCFGPLELSRNKEKYGYITSTPKLAWADYDILGNLKKHLHVPVEISTDVSGAALGEITFGDYEKENTLLYITVGTGIGGGYVIDGKIHNGMLHPEMGHILVTKNPRDTYKGACPYHENCLEGLAAGPANEGRTGMKGIDIPDDHESFHFIAEYMAEALMSYILVLSPTKIVLGGGVMARTHMLPEIRRILKEKLNDYIKTDQLSDLYSYIVTPSLGTESGIKGALALALMAE
ncbi:ROK family protein [Proteiniclasticum sp. C24MP]|uniref:ROK family protein n=1 Tax=Proteiniclasticum sp. C24MP TaxID=3374101 RepID=UPI003754DB0B